MNLGNMVLRIDSGPTLDIMVKIFKFGIVCCQLRIGCPLLVETADYFHWLRHFLS